MPVHHSNNLLGGAQGSLKLVARKLKIALRNRGLHRRVGRVPEIRRLAELEIDAIRSEDNDAVVILEAAVLFEAGWQDAVDEVWVAVVPPEVAIARASARDGVDADAVKKRLDAQLSNEERTARANHVIDNSGDEDALEREVQTAWSRVRAG